jgi:hypothetical protein
MQEVKQFVDVFLRRRLGFGLRSDHVGFVVEKTGTGEIFLLILRLPLEISPPQTAPRSLKIIDAIKFRYWQRRKITDLKKGGGHSLVDSALHSFVYSGME